MSALLDHAARLDPVRAADLAANDVLAGIPRTVVSGSEWLAATGRNYWRLMAANRGECYLCGEKDGQHERGCTDAPDEVVA